MFKWFNEIFNKIFIVFGAFLFSQIPQFIQQYVQRLGGHIAELKYQINSLNYSSSMGLKQYVISFIYSDKKEAMQQNIVLEKMTERLQDLSSAWNGLLEATTFSKPLVFLSTLQLDVARGTFEVFQPGFMLTTEGILYALAGILMFHFIYLFFSSILRSGYLLMQKRYLSTTSSKMSQ